MKRAILTLLFLASVATAQTNVYTTIISPIPKLKDGCAVPAYYCVGTGNFLPTAKQPSNTWYYPTTNILTISFTNRDELLIAGSAFGYQYCGKGSLTFTDINYPNDVWRFAMRWSNNLPIPTNLPVPLTTVGFRTNGP